MAIAISEEALYQKSSQEITSLLYEACLDNLEEAMTSINHKEYIDANISLKKANDILQRLGMGLNYEAGIIADQLEAIYNYIANLLIEANLKKDGSKVEEAHQLLSMITTAWNQALKQKDKQTASQVFTKKTAVYNQFSAYDDE